MVKRLISANASDISGFSTEELKQSIKASEGRTVLSENVVVHMPALVQDITNAEMASAFGADMILLNALDVIEPDIQGLYNEEYKGTGNAVQDLKHFVGRPIGVNLEPVDDKAKMAEVKLDISSGRKATKETFEQAKKLGFDFVCLTGNPATGVTNEHILEAVKIGKTHFDGLIIAGKMHGSGVDEPVVNLEAIKQFVEAGADIILVPAVGTVWGVSEDEVREAVQVAHRNGALVMSAIGTSQEGSDEATIREIAIKNKTLGVDIQHIGDAGYGGLAPVENIYALSKAIRGQRHTVSRISRSINR
ncbi:haloacid dehalogenase-like hydrolase [Mammaliicoccus fleurettii]|nr:haloacid dehalogenase-like hydrolase [Mammaliicoccus fleurettii]